MRAYLQKGAIAAAAIALFLAAYIAYAAVGDYMTIRSHGLLPDIVPLPPRDVSLKVEGEQISLRFSTTYFNKGAGPVELRFDENASSEEGDRKSTVVQRIYLDDGDTTIDRHAGTFLWHDAHRHYHFSDFVQYTLERLDRDSAVVLDTIKSTFCLRDVSRALLDLPNRSPDGAYETCDSQMQGSSVGWGETYYYDYPGQQIDLTGLSSGTYRLTTMVNPDRLIREGAYDNNSASITFVFDAEVKIVEQIEEFPDDAPAVEHVRLRTPFGERQTEEIEAVIP